MKTKKIGSKTRITFTYFEWCNAGKEIPPHEVIEGKIEYVIHGVPEDKKEFFENFGWRVVLATSMGRGMKK